MHPDLSTFFCRWSFRTGNEFWVHIGATALPWNLGVWHGCSQLPSAFLVLFQTRHKALKSLEQDSGMMKEGPLRTHEKSREICPFLMYCVSPEGEAKCLSLIVVSHWLRKGCFWQLYSSLVFLPSLLSSTCREARGAAAASLFTSKFCKLKMSQNYRLIAGRARVHCRQNVSLADTMNWEAMGCPCEGKAHCKPEGWMENRRKYSCTCERVTWHWISPVS